MLWLIRIKNIFSRFCGNIYTIEYQKRGLPHMHLFIFLTSAKEFFETSYIDEVIYVKLLMIESDSTSELKRIVTSIMLHGLFREINSY